MLEIVNSPMAAVASKFMQDRHADRYLGSVPRIEANDDLGGEQARTCHNIRVASSPMNHVQNAIESCCLSISSHQQGIQPSFIVTHVVDVLPSGKC